MTQKKSTDNLQIRRNLSRNLFELRIRRQYTIISMSFTESCIILGALNFLDEL